MRNSTVLISGASIAGPALAYWLHRHGFRPTVVEIAPALRPGGQAVDLRGAAITVAERMGVLPRIRAERVDERGIAFVDGRDRPLARMPAELHGGEGIVAEYEIMRGDLTRVLFDATRADTEYLFGDRIAELSQGDDGVKVLFASGRSRTFDLVVGADGVHSATRALAFGPEREYVRHLGAYTAYFTVPDPGDLDHWFRMYNAPGGRVAAIRPERGGTAKAMLSFTSPPLGYDRRDQRAQRELLAAAFAGVGWRVPAMLDAMPAAPDFFFDQICQVHLARWARGRVGLVGDAAYCGSPLTGLGTSASLVGAYVLAGELAAAGGDHERGFARYQEEMRDFVTACQQLPPGGVRGFAPRSQTMITLRALSMRMVTAWPMRGVLARQAAKSTGITLREYA